MKVAVIGAGAMGLLYGGCLANIGHDVTLIGGRSIPVIKKQGLRLDTAWTGDIVVFPKAVTAAEAGGDFELLIVLTKTFQTEAAMDSIRHILNDKMHVLSMQNGLGNRELLARYVKPEQVMIGMTLYPSDLVEPGHIHSAFANTGAIVDAFEEQGQVTERTKMIAAELEKAGIHHITGDGAWEFIWEKIIFNSVGNSISTLMEVSSEYMEAIGVYELGDKMVDEGVAVAEACGVKISAEALKKRMRDIWSIGLHHAPSMLVDFVNGRMTEVDSINGGIVREGRAHGIPTPINEVMVPLIHMKEKARGLEYRP